MLKSETHFVFGAKTRKFAGIDLEISVQEEIRRFRRGIGCFSFTQSAGISKVFQSARFTISAWPNHWADPGSTDVAPEPSIAGVAAVCRRSRNSPGLCSGNSPGGGSWLMFYLMASFEGLSGWLAPGRLVGR